VPGTVARGAEIVNCVSRARLKEVLHYDPKTGVFTRLKMTGCKGVVGAQVGALKQHGYVGITIDGCFKYAHQLAFLYMTGVIPKEIDHKNGERADNRWENLREATRTQKNGNQKKYRGKWPKGVVKLKTKKPTHKAFWARIHKGNRAVSLGLFHTPEEAHEAYLEAAKEYFGEAFARSK